MDEKEKSEFAAAPVASAPVAGKPRLFEPSAGQHIGRAAIEMVAVADATGETVEMTFNDVILTATPGENPDAMVAEFERISEERRRAYVQSPEYIRQQEEYARKTAERESALKAALDQAPRLELSDPEKWQSWVDANKDPYGSACVRYAEKWGRLMQLSMSRGEELEACADKTSHIADDEGITGFMYGCAVGMLSAAWIHGERLRRWHNLKTQIGTEGEKANESGGVLNPAVLNIGG